MIISSKGEITDAIEVPDGLTLFEYFRVRVMVGDVNAPECVGIEDFQKAPDNAQILWAVLKHKGSYAEVKKILVPDVLPFSDGGCQCDCNGDCDCCDTARKLDDVEFSVFETEDDLPL